MRGHRARVCALPNGSQAQAIPKGPCLVEKLEGSAVEVIWGARGQNCTTLAFDDAAGAEARGDLVLLD